jgi:hypothetical protein
VKIKSKKKDYYMKTNSSVSGIGLNVSRPGAEMFEINNTAIDQKMVFWNDDEEYDSENPGNSEVYLLIFSESIVNSNKRIIFQKAVSSNAPVVSRLLQEETTQSNSSSSDVDIFFSRYEMDENFKAIKGFTWWFILLIIIGILLLILLIVFLIYCCCCRKKEEKSAPKSTIYKNNADQSSVKKKSVTSNKADIPPTPNSEIAKSNTSNPHSLYQDSFHPPVVKKEGDSKINHYLPNSSENNNAL